MPAKKLALPGMEDRAIADLHTAAESYADIRERRQALTTEEVALKRTILALMHKHKLTHYAYTEVEITLVPEEETVKVKIRRSEKDDEEARHGD